MRKLQEEEVTKNVHHKHKNFGNDDGGPPEEVIFMVCSALDCTIHWSPVELAYTHIAQLESKIASQDREQATLQAECNLIIHT